MTPTIFVAHGSPLLLDDAEWVFQLQAWARSLPEPSAILIVSAHWQQSPISVGATQPVPLVYDFTGFEDRHYGVKYAAPGAPELASRVAGLLGTTRGVWQAPERGLDHGAYVPLVAMYPRADVPVLQLSLPSEDPDDLYALGRELAPLRDEGVLVAGSGFLTHNLATVDFRPDAPTPSWARAFDNWVAETLEAGNVKALLDYERLAPGVRQVLPTREHLMPLFVALGAAGEDVRNVSFPVQGFSMGSFSKRSVQFG